MRDEPGASGLAAGSYLAPSAVAAGLAALLCKLDPLPE
jgi:hypothetical protein